MFYRIYRRIFYWIYLIKVGASRMHIIKLSIIFKRIFILQLQRRRRKCYIVIFHKNQEILDTLVNKR